jgi:hypothetical protein
MSTDIQTKLEKLGEDYNRTRGRQFTYFFCPILFKDDDVPLCKAHLVNRAFADSSRGWTVQRKDVDNFYGSTFEADFVAIQYHENRNLGNTIIDKKLSRSLNPKFLVDGEPVEFYITDTDIPKHFTRVEFDNDGEITQLGLKISPEDMLAATKKNWEIAISKDIRIPALVSLIKAAHLTLFELLGYSYALSAGGHFVGRQILGEFFLRNHEKAKPEVLEDALPFFREFAHMVRPVQSSAINFQGTITDNLLLICKGSNTPPWAFIIFIKTSQSLHAVMIPIFEQPDAVAQFIRFQQDDNDSIEVVLSQFDHDHWKIDKKSTKLTWPKRGVLYPE